MRTKSRALWQPDEVGVTVAIYELDVPESLVRDIAERRVIPFIGAGFSQNHGLPGWHELLRNVHEELGSAGRAKWAPDEANYEVLAAGAGDDPLQLAEYLYLRADQDFGPILYALGRSLAPKGLKPLLESTPHVELANLNAPLVYTTNYDGLIEGVYHSLGIEVDVIALPRDMARTRSGVPQVVKYHGDLRHGSTIVFTQRQYFERLSLDSPIDLKLRADLFGRSVLFLGYGFQDINVRLIWHKLMDVMTEVPSRWRPTSYIVLFSRNPVLEELYHAVGIRTIVLPLTRQSSRRDVFSQFMLELSLAAAGQRGRNDDQPARHVSTGLLAAIDEALDQDSNTAAEILSGRVNTLLSELARREVPETLRSRLSDTLRTTALNADRLGVVRMLAPSLLDFVARTMTGPADPGSTFFMLSAWLDSSPLRQQLGNVPRLRWHNLWQGRLEADDAQHIVNKLRSALGAQTFTEDLGYTADVVRRIATGTLAVNGPRADAVRADAQDVTAMATERFPGLSTMAVVQDSAPPVPVP